LQVNPSITHSMYYVAIVCPPGVDEKVMQFKQWMKEQFGCVVALKSPAHITLIQPFWLDNERETDLLQTLHSFSGDGEELLIQFDGFSHFGNRVLFIQVKENSALQRLQKQTEKHFLQYFNDVIKKDARAIHPHITIANRDMKPGDFEKAWQHFSGKKFDETFWTKAISLLKLSLGKWNVIGKSEWL
jgi:2'-5' RNA ligase